MGKGVGWEGKKEREEEGDRQTQTIPLRDFQKARRLAKLFPNFADSAGVSVWGFMELGSSCVCPLSAQKVSCSSRQEV